MVMSILLETVFWQTLIQDQLVVKKLMAWLDEDKTTFKAIDKCRYGLPKNCLETPYLTF